MLYTVAERFKSIQGEGCFAGTPMAFIRFVGCSVGKRVCSACDTDFERTLPWRGGGEYEEGDLLSWAYDHRHICLTGGEPLDRNLEPILAADRIGFHFFHIETSGTQLIPDYLDSETSHVCVSPKPGFLEAAVLRADEVKVIVPGLGAAQAEGWPTLDDALRWYAAGKIVYLQPRNSKHEVDQQNLRYVQDLLREHTGLRLSLQWHKVLKVQ
jgi:7-carboxy-7-deazaguanine synthase